MIKHRQPPYGLRRVGAAALVVALSLAVGGAIFVVGMVGTSLCDAEGFACLNWLFAGAIAGGVAAAAVSVLAGRRLGLGWTFGLVLIGVAALALLPLQGWARMVLVALAPVIAFVLTWPRLSDQPVSDPNPAAKRRVGWSLVALGLLLGIVGGSVLWQERSLLTYRMR